MSNNENELRCPCCFSKLVNTHQDRYVTIDEHVLNIEPTFKDGYQCLNERCVAPSMGATWVRWGSVFLDSPVEFQPGVALEVMEKFSHEGCISALGSSERTLFLYEKEKLKRTHQWKLGKLVIRIRPKARKGSYEERLTDIKKNFWKIDIEMNIKTQNTFYEHEKPLTLPWVEFRKKYNSISTLFLKSVRNDPHFEEAEFFTHQLRALTRLLYPQPDQELHWSEKLAIFAWKSFNPLRAKKVRKLSEKVRQHDARSEEILQDFVNN